MNLLSIHSFNKNVKYKIKQLMIAWHKHHYITTTMTNERDKTVCLTEQGLAWKQSWGDLEMESAFIHWID